MRLAQVVGIYVTRCDGELDRLRHIQGDCAELERVVGEGSVASYTLTEARKAKATEEAPAAPLVHEGSSSPTLFEFAKGCLADPLAPRVQHGTDRYETAYRLRIHDALGAYRLDELTAPVVREWCDGIVRVYGTRRCGEYAYRTLHWLLNRALDEGLVSSNVAAGINYQGRARAAVRNGAPSAEDHERKKPTLNRAQYAAVKTHALSVGLKEAVLIRLAVEGTMRRAELLGLQWAGFVPGDRVFFVAKGVTATKATGRIRGETKNRQSVRTVVLSNDLVALLTRYREQCRREGHGDTLHYLFPGYRKHRLDRPVPTLPLHPRTATEWACALVRDAEVVNEDGEHLTDLQGLRATGASIADAAGVPESLIEAQLGHKGRSVYQRNYRDVRTAPERFQFADVFETDPQG